LLSANEQGSTFGNTQTDSLAETIGADMRPFAVFLSKQVPFGLGSFLPVNKTGSMD
jgi:hypothetical protein